VAADRAARPRGLLPRFGFESADALGLRCPYPVAPEHWMAYRLPAYDPGLRGAFRYAAAFALA
jgi:putative acetyltransferase